MLCEREQCSRLRIKTSLPKQPPLLGTLHITRELVQRRQGPEPTCSGYMYLTCLWRIKLLLGTSSPWGPWRTRPSSQREHPAHSQTPGRATSPGQPPRRVARCFLQIHSGASTSFQASWSFQLLPNRPPFSFLPRHFFFLSPPIHRSNLTTDRDKSKIPRPIGFLLSEPPFRLVRALPSILSF